MPNRPYTREPFTVALCMQCSAEPQSLLQQLGSVIRQCPHGILVTTHCLLGRFTCATAGSDRGAVLALQPCSKHRAPTGAVIWIGPVDTDADAQDACDWIAAGRWNRENLPGRLRADLNLARISSRN